MSKTEAVEKAIKLARGTIEQKGVAELCTRRGLKKGNDERYYLRLLDREIRIHTRDAGISEPDGSAVSSREELLVLHYLVSPGPLRERGDPISFREFPGGRFYWAPFQGRTVGRLVRKIGNDSDGLARALAPFRWSSYDKGDFGACVKGIGDLCVFLVYWVGDEEFHPRADILFDPRTKDVFSAEDTVVLAELLCAKILSRLEAES